MAEALYKLQEENTMGWYDISDPLPRVECEKLLIQKMNEGVAPDHLKVVRVQ